MKNRLTKPGTVLVFVLLNFTWGTQIVAQRPHNNARTQGTILATVPSKIDVRARYLFYLHGYIVEAGNIRPVSPTFGVYEYEQILKTFKRRGFIVISEARKKDPDIEPYAHKVAAQVEQLLRGGVPPKQITVVGGSQGSWIAMLASTYLKNRELNFVLLSGGAADDGLLDLVDLHGNVLSIHERSEDLPQSCEKFRTDATGISNWKEIELNTGLKHGFLFRPIKDWVEPTIAWAKR
jgi:pimeloyl-ACP methyl ester carboxylesterase